MSGDRVTLHLDPRDQAWEFLGSRRGGAPIRVFRVFSTLDRDDADLRLGVLGAGDEVALVGRIGIGRARTVFSRGQRAPSTRKLEQTMEDHGIVVEARKLVWFDGAGIRLVIDGNARRVRWFGTVDGVVRSRSSWARFIQSWVTAVIGVRPWADGVLLIGVKR